MDRIEPESAGPHGVDAPGTRDDDQVRDRFTAFVDQHWSGLVAIGIAVSGSRHEAEDLVQSALTNAFPRWGALRSEDALAYVRRSIVNGNVSRWRRTRHLVSVPDVPERAAGDGLATSDAHLTLLPLVRDLPPRQRAVVVLRYLCDLSDADIAETLAISPTTVRSQALRALAALRAAAERGANLEETS